MAHLKIENLSAAFGSHVVFKDFNLTVNDGEIMGIVGPSGCGKTSLARCIAGLMPAQSGLIELGERCLFNFSEKINIPPERRRLGMVFQDYAVWPHKTVEDNVMYPLQRRKVPKTERAVRVDAALKQVRMLEYKNHLPSQLSGGQQQRVAIARALVASEDLIILDEPITNLDAKLREEMIVEIKLLQKTIGTTILYITHDQETALKLCDRICIMERDGRIAQIGEDEDIILRPENRFVFEFIGVSNFLEAEYDGQKLEILLPKGRIECPPDLFGEELARYIDNWNPSSEKLLFDIGIRPNNILFDPTSPIRAKVIRSVFLGAQDDYFLELNGLELRVELNALTALREGRPQPGDEVGLRFLNPFIYLKKEATA